MPESTQNDSASPIQISLGRLQALEKDFQKHKDFWTGQEPYMRVILETTQIIHQGLVAALAKLDKRQGQAIQNLSKRIDNLIGQTTTPAEKPITTGHEAAVSQETCGKTSSGQGLLFDAKPVALLNDLMQQMQILHQEITSVRRDQANMLKDLAKVNEQLALQNGALGYLYQKAASQDGLLPESETDTADHETVAAQSGTDGTDREADACASETGDETSKES